MAAVAHPAPAQRRLALCSSMMMLNAFHSTLLVGEFQCSMLSSILKITLLAEVVVPSGKGEEVRCRRGKATPKND
jgi:hypothetical protein